MPDLSIGENGHEHYEVERDCRTNELQVWFLAEHVVDVPLVRADDAPNGE